MERRKWIVLVFSFILALGLISAPESRAQVPVTVYGYVYMPDGSPASDAKVTVKAGGVSKSTTTGADGRYKVDLTVESVPVTVTVTAKKGQYTGSATKTVEGSARIDIHLKAPPPPPPPEKPKVSIQIWCETAEVAVNETVVVRGSVDKDIAEVVVVVKNPRGESSRASVPVEDRRFNYSFKPDLVGSWVIYAMFEGNDKYGKSTSASIKVRIKYPASLSIVGLEASGQTVVVQGRVDPPLEQALIMVYISVDGGMTWFYLANTTTNSEGFFRLKLNFSITGTLYIKAVFPGDDYYLLAQDAKTVRIEPSPAGDQKTNETMAWELKRYVEENERLRQQLDQARRQKQQLEARAEELETKLAQTMAQLNQTLTQINQLKHQIQLFYRQCKIMREIDQQRLYTSMLIALAAGTVIGAALTLVVDRAIRASGRRQK